MNIPSLKNTLLLKTLAMSEPTASCHLCAGGRSASMSMATHSSGGSCWRLGGPGNFLKGNNELCCTDQLSLSWTIFLYRTKPINSILHTVGLLSELEAVLWNLLLPCQLSLCDILSALLSCQQSSQHFHQEQTCDSPFHLDTWGHCWSIGGLMSTWLCLRN